MSLLSGLFGSNKSSSSSNYSDNSRNANAEGEGISAMDSMVAKDGGVVFGAGTTINNDLSADVVARALSSIDAASILQSEIALNGINRASATADAVVAGANAMVENNAKLAGQSMDTALAFTQQAAGSLTSAGTNRTYAIAGMIAVMVIGFAFLFRRKKR
ncbi:LPXTG cell wall anchor domain-containing protein [Termitidicoccus mucosus]|uniref:Uncharacterized protein n=1 Tax=Termitidicoccus mucosus TaxID=1184151 RepID=A0A178ICX6_9BACT|nr:hypothetical protein AW736_21915 [Opitutaceae bacterium TSB47]